MAKLCICPGRKCGCLATPHVIKYVNDNLGLPLEVLKEWVIQRARWRRVRTTAFGKGVEKHNVETFIQRVQEKQSKAALCDLLDNHADKYHETIENESYARMDEEYDYPWGNDDDGLYLDIDQW